MQQARHTGKIVLRMPEQRTANAAVQLRPDATYLISGGLGALGLLTARWMADRSARNILLLGRSDPDGNAASQIEQLEALGVRVRVVQADVAFADQVSRALGEARQSLPPLRGIVHAAGQLDDGIVVRQTPERFNHVMGPKVSRRLEPTPADAGRPHRVFLSCIRRRPRCWGRPGNPTIQPPTPSWMRSRISDWRPDCPR